MGQELALAMDNFEAHLRYERRLSEHTVMAYLTDVRQMADYLSRAYEIADVALIAGIHLRSWLAELKEKQISGRSLRRKIAAQNTFFHFLMSEGQLKKNPARKLLLPKVDKPLPKFLEEKQTEQLKAFVLFPDSFEGLTQQLIIELLYQTGMRRAELIGLKERDIHYSRKEIQVLGKGGKMRILPLNASLLSLLKDYTELKKKTFGIPIENVLSLKSGKPLYPNYVYRVVKMYLSAVTTLEKKSPHILRHTFASQLLNNGADLISIKDLLGHASLAATQVYTHLNIERLKKVYKNAHPKS
jgi:integrase/recombinase XerC